MVLTAIISLYSVGLRELMDERDNVISSLLAQEGIELVRNIRDNEWALNGSMLDSNSELEVSTGCRIDINSDSCNGTDYVLSQYTVICSNMITV